MDLRKGRSPSFRQSFFKFSTHARATSTTTTNKESKQRHQAQQEAILTFAAFPTAKLTVKGP